MASLYNSKGERTRLTDGDGSLQRMQMGRKGEGVAGGGREEGIVLYASIQYYIVNVQLKTQL